MSRMLSIVAGSVVLLGLALLAFGVGQPREHVVTSRVLLPVPAESAWAAMRDIPGTVGWWRDLTEVRRGSAADGAERWEESVDGFTMTVRVEELEAGARFRTVIEGRPDASFGGTWTYEVRPAGDGAEVRVTEAGWVSNPFFRAFAHLGGLHATLDSYLTALGQRFGQAVTPEHVSTPS